MSITPSSAKILLIGENGIDEFVVCDCRRLAPEAPIPVAQPLRIETNPGMAANVAANIISLGGPSVHFIHQTAEIRKTRYVDDASGQQMLRVDTGDDSFEPDFWTKVIDGMAANPDGYCAIVVSDYDKGMISTAMMAALSEIARELRVPMWVDTKKILGVWSRDIDFVKINEKEFRAQIAAGVTEPWKQCRNLIVTKGRDGAIIYSRDGSIDYHSASWGGKVWSVSGCGDSTFAALVVNYLANGGNIRSALDYSMAAAAVAVSKPGVVAVTAREVEELMS